MKKIICITVFLILCSKMIFASPYDVPALSPEYYDITKSSSDLLVTVIMYPVIIDYTSNNYASYSLGAYGQLYLFDRIGINGIVSKSIFSMQFSEEGDNKQDISNTHLEGGVSFAFYSKVSNDKYPITIGSRMTGPNTRTDYFVNIIAPTRKMTSVRVGYMRDLMEYSLDDGFNLDEPYDIAVDIVYSGIEFIQSRSLDVLFNHEQIETEFGSEFKNKEFFKFYLDLMYGLRDSGNIDRGKDLGFRTGILANNGLLSFNLEGGYSPLHEFYGKMAIGMAISFYEPDKNTND